MNRCSVNLFDMDSYDRTFVLGLIDSLKEYERPKLAIEQPAPSADDAVDPEDDEEAAV